jgi:hypothetical protein
MSLNYCSIDHILMEEEKIPSTFMTSVYGIGFLDPANSEFDLPADTKMEFPFWLANKLRKFKIVDIDYPTAYERRRLNNLKLSPTHESLGKFPYFFELGIKLSRRIDHGEVGQILLECLSPRFLSVFDSAMNLPSEKFNDLKCDLTNMENQLLMTGFRVRNQLLLWKNKKLNVIQSSEAISKKRKRE